MNNTQLPVEGGLNFSGKFTRFDTKALVGAVIIGVVFVLVQQVAHRIDMVISPASVIVGGITWATFTGLATLIFRQPAGLIMGEVQAVIAIASGLSPVAFFFVFANGLGSLAYSLVSWKLSMRKWSHHFVAQLATNLVGNACVAVGLKIVLGLPVPVILVASTITASVGTVGATFFTKTIADNLTKSGLLD